MLVIGPGALQVADPVGLAFAFSSSIGCAVYFVIAARPSDGLPPVALAASGLVLGGVVLAVLGASGLVPFTATFGELPFLGGTAPWWLPLLLVAVGLGQPSPMPRVSRAQQCSGLASPPSSGCSKWCSRRCSRGCSSASNWHRCNFSAAR